MQDAHSPVESAALLPSSPDEEGQLYGPTEFEKERSPLPVRNVWRSTVTFFSSIELGRTTRVCREWAVAILLFLLPSFISSRIGQKGERGAPKPLRPTAYLDGLRGVAAWSVFNGHLTSTLNEHNKIPWGFKGGYEDFCDSWRLPFFRIAINGAFAVSLFFVISGFALSISPISTMRKRPQDPAVAMSKLSSAIFRRPFRLFVPSFASTIMVFILVRLGYWAVLYKHEGQFHELFTAHNGKSALGHWPKVMPSIWEQVKDLLKYDRNLISVFSNWKGRFPSKYNGPLWTIALEFRSSLVLYLTHAALFYMKKSVRVIILISLVILGTSIHAMDFPLFWAGNLLAEYSPHLPSEPISSPSLPTVPAVAGEDHKRKHVRIYRTIRNILAKVIPWLIFVVGICLGSFPRQNAGKMPLYSWIRTTKPFSYPSEERFYDGIGAIALILAIDRISILARFYCLPVIQYLGTISFAFYLCHLTIVKGIAQYFFWAAWSMTGQSNCATKVLGFLIGYLMSISLTIWMADIFWRSVDAPTVRFAAKFENWLKAR